MVDTAYTNNGGTGDRTADITVTSNMFGAADPNDLVDGNTTAGIAMTPGVGDGYITFDFGSGADPVIDAFRYYIQAGVAYPNNIGVWLFEGSNNGSTWVNLSSSGGLWFFFTTNGSTISVIEVTGFQSTTGYRYFRMSQAKSSVPPSGLSLMEVEFKINGSAATPDPPPPSPPTPDYTEPGGTGDRSALIWVSQNFAEKNNDGGNARFLVNGSLTADATNAVKFNFSEFAQYSAEIIFDFRPSGFKQRIIGFKWYQSAVLNIGTWAFEASDEAASGWITLLGGIDLGASTNAEHLFTNASGYRFYRLRKTDSDIVLSEAQWMQEIEFKIGHTDELTEPLAVYDTSDRTSEITFTLANADFTLSPNAGAWQANVFDGSNANVVWWEVGTEGDVIFEFDNPIAINEMRWQWSGDSGQGYWRAYGSNDGSSYQALGRAPQRLNKTDGTSDRGIFNGFGANQRAFRFYKLTLVHGSTIWSHNTQEITFRGFEVLPDPGDQCFSYYNTGGSGNRVTGTGDGSVVVTKTPSAITIGTSLNQLIDGTWSSSDWVGWDNSVLWELKFEFTAGPKLVKQIALKWNSGGAGTATVVQVAGSNDGSTWTNIGPTQNISDSSEQFNTGTFGHIPPGSNGADAGHDQNYFYIILRLHSNDTAFRYYRITNASGSSGTFGLGQVEFFVDGAAANFPLPSDKYALCNGNRTSQIDIDLTGTLTNGVISNLIDGVAAENDNDAVKFTAGQTGVIIHWDMGERFFAFAVTFSAFAPGSDTHGTHYFEGSNDDVNWDVLLDPFHGGISFASVWTNYMSAYGNYRYFRIRQKTGAWQNSFYVNEMTFLGAPSYSIGTCAGDPPPVVNPLVVFHDEGEFIVTEASPFAATFRDEGEFIVEMTTVDPVTGIVFMDEGEFQAALTITAPPVHPVVQFTDEGQFLAREEHEPIAVVQSLIIVSGR